MTPNEGKQDAAVIVSTCTLRQFHLLYLRSVLAWQHGKGDNGRSSAEVHKAIRAFELMRCYPGADHGLGAETGAVAGGADACFEIRCGVFCSSTRK